MQYLSHSQQPLLLSRLSSFSSVPQCVFGEIGAETLFGIHQPHPDDHRYPKWSATKWPRYYIVERNGWKIVEWEYFQTEWFVLKTDAEQRQAEFNQTKQDVDALYIECEDYNRPRREALVK